MFVSKLQIQFKIPKYEQNYPLLEQPIRIYDVFRFITDFNELYTKQTDVMLQERAIISQLNKICLSLELPTVASEAQFMRQLELKLLREKV